MQNHESIFELIDQCDFPNENPFELSEDLFPVLNSVASLSVTKLFEKTCYNSWLIFGFDGESQVSVFYDSILQKFQDGSLDNYYGHLTPAEKKQIANNFVEIIADELRHRDIFSAIIAKTKLDSVSYRPDYYNPKCQEYVDSQWKLWDDYTLLDHLCPIVTGESYLLAAFVLFYKYTTNPYKKQIFKEFIQEESRHIAHFMNFMKKANIQDHERPRFHRAFIHQVEQKIKFEYTKFLTFLDTIVKDSNKKPSIIKTAYDTEFHHTFSKIFLKKSWQFYNIVCPGVDQDTYESWLYKINN